MNEKLENKILLKLIDHDDRLKNIETKLTKLDRFDEILVGQDQILGILKTMQTEQVSTKHAISRHEDRIERLEDHLELSPLAV